MELAQEMNDGVSTRPTPPIREATPMTPLFLGPLIPEFIPAAVTLDHQVLGGLWTADGYQREIDSPNGLILALLPGRDPLPADPTERNLMGMGCLWMIVDEAHITILAIAPAHRRQGLGRVLLLALLEEARVQGMTRATLEVRATNEVAIALYESLGFQEAGRRKQYYQNPGEDARIFWCNGLQSPDFAENLCRWKEEGRDRLHQHGWEILP